MSDAPEAARQARAEIARVMAEDQGRLTAALAARLGDLDLAEDCLQGAFEKALTHWGRSGTPDHPQAWLLRVAHRLAIDRFRRDARFRMRIPEIETLSRHEAELAERPEIPDERLRLILACCHPALEPKSRVALTLRMLGGLTTEEIARAFLDKPATMGQRLSRAKAKIRDAEIPFALPGAADLPARTTSVCDVIYLIFNEGYAATAGAAQLRVDLCNEAVFLARLMHGLCPEDAEVAGVLALILLTHARRGARIGPDGIYVPLSEQDRSLWDGAMISEGTALLERTLARGRAGPFQVKAAIAALHGQAAAFAATDWAQIYALYRLLAVMEPGPVVDLNMAVAQSHAEGPRPALATLEALAGSLEGYQPYHAARADMLRRLGRNGAARLAYDAALALTRIDSERAFLTARRDGLSGADP